MPSIDLVVETETSTSIRGRQVSSMFDVPFHEGRASLSWKGELPIEDRAWSVGAIVGPSGSGKSTILSGIFGQPMAMQWGGKSMVDDFHGDLSISDIAAACSAVGFNTIPAWMRPFAVLSNGEKFRAELARQLAEAPDPIVVDEFTSVVDRQVAQIASHAIQKAVRSRGRKLVVASCHYDIIDWLQPDWVLEPATMSFSWRSVQRRPGVELEIRRVPWATWRLFAPYHYLTAELARSATCFAAHVQGRPVSFAAILHRPHPTVPNIKGISRLVTLPDWQGLGLAFALADALGGAYKAIGYRLHMYPAHPSLTRSFDRSAAWALKKKPGQISHRQDLDGGTASFGGRPCAVFQYVGPSIPSDQAKQLLR